MLTTAPARAHQGQAAEDKTIPWHAFLLLFQTFLTPNQKHTPNVNDSSLSTSPSQSHPTPPRSASTHLSPTHAQGQTNHCGGRFILVVALLPAQTKPLHRSLRPQRPGEASEKHPPVYRDPSSDCESTDTAGEVGHRCTALISSGST